MSNNRFAPYYGFHGQDAASYGNFFGDSLRNNTRFADNFVLKFGKDKSQSLQVLYENVSQLRYQNLGGFAGLPNYLFDPLALGQPALPFVTPLPFTPSTNLPATGPELAVQDQTRFLKIEYDNSFNASTYLTPHCGTTTGNNSKTPTASTKSGRSTAAWPRMRTRAARSSARASTSRTRSADKLTVTLNGQYTVTHPILNLQAPIFAVAFGPIGDFITPAGGCPASGPGYDPVRQRVRELQPGRRVGAFARTSG